MSKFFAEFKKFITRGNVIDMSVGVIVGSAFTAIVNALGNNILKPLINWLLSVIFGANSLSEVFTFLTKAFDAEGNVDLANSIYIDWGAFVNAIINFFITAFVLFCIVRFINNMKEGNAKLVSKTLGGLTKDDVKAMKAQGLNFRNEDDVKKYTEAKAKAEEEAKKAEAEKAAKERAENPTAEDLLKEIRDLLKK